MKNKRRLIFALIFFAAIGCAAAGMKTGAIPRMIGQWLEVSSPLEKADVIYVYAGGTIERPGHAAELYKEGYAPHVVVAGIEVAYNLAALGLYYNEGALNRKMAISNGVPDEAIIQIREGTSTYEETVALKKLLTERKLKSAILVSSPFHMRRVRMCARRVFRGTDIKLMFAPVPDSLVSLDAWWKLEHDMITVAVEYIKLVYYFIKYR